MKIELTKDGQIKGLMRKAGEVVIVRKEDGERLIKNGLAERVVEEPENRVVELPENRTRGIPQKRFGPQKFGR